MNTMQANVDKFGAQINLWFTKLDVLVAHAVQAGAQAKLDHHQRYDDLGPKPGTAQSKLALLKASGVQQWVMLKAEVGSAWNDLSK